MSPISEILFFGEVLPLITGIFFVVAVWQGRRNRALFFAGLIVGSSLAATMFHPPVENHVRFTLTAQDIIITVLETILPLAVMAFFVRAIRSRKKVWAIAAGIILVVILTPVLVAFALMTCMPASGRNTDALFDKMQAEHVAGWTYFLTTTQKQQDAGWSTEKLLKQYGPPASTRTEGSVIIWAYSANPWYLLSIDYVDVWIEQGKVTAITKEP